MPEVANVTSGGAAEVAAEVAASSMTSTAVHRRNANTGFASSPLLQKRRFAALDEDANICS